MPTLTWRNVDAPSFAGSFDGLRTASSMLGNATRSGIDLVDTFKQANADVADRAILNRTLGFQDPAAYASALADGSLVGSDGAKASLSTLAGLDTRAGTLINRALVQENLNQTSYTNNRGQQADALMDAAGPDAWLYRTLVRDNNQEAASRLLETSETLRALRSDQHSALLSEGDQLTSGAQGRWRFGNEVTNQNDTKTAQKLWLDISRNNGTPEDVQAAVNGQAGNISPGAQAALLNFARGAGYNLNGPVGSGASGGLGVAAPSSFSGTPSSSKSVSIMTGGAQLPDSIVSVGDFVDNKSALLKTNPKGTATGLWQITADTWKDFAPNALGAGWRGANIRDPQVQNKVAEAIWNSAKGSADSIKGRWASVNQAEAESMKGKSWNEVRDVLSRKESGALFADTVPAQTPAGAAAPVEDTATTLINQAMRRSGNNLGADITRKQLKERAGQNQANEIFPDLDKLQFDSRVPAEVASELVGANGAYSGSDRGVIAAQINKLIERSGNRISAATAGRILASNSDRSDSLITRVGSRVADIFRENDSTPNLAGGMRIDDAGAYQMLDNVLSGASSRQQTAQSSLGATDELVQSLRERYNAADALYQQMLAQSKSRPGLAANLARYKQKRDVAEEALSRVVQSVNNTDTLTPQFNRPVAQTKGATGSW